MGLRGFLKIDYNGWKNYETWAVGMYLDGNYTGPATHSDALETVAAAIADHPRSEHWTEEQATRYAVADALHMYVEESSGFPETGLAAMWCRSLS